jgi:hypothetical protein
MEEMFVHRIVVGFLCVHVENDRWAIEKITTLAKMVFACFEVNESFYGPERSSTCPIDSFVSFGSVDCC